ncbi:ATP-binding cassette domain-containing protein [Paenibacillus piri]|uniref:ATP-binding cassette domain-containing protein n=2 Tax=Paenibacillus piri TaxID=2547395 RepID=A0A4R5KBB6_9BACL|nr:ATP-binding cassette domain-containing protein [Paenibacillus piri]
MTITRPADNRSDPILHDCSCRLQKNTITLIAGQTGSGKSTFLSGLAGLIPPVAGSITYDGQPLWTGSRLNNAVRFNMGVLFQYPERQLFADSIRKEFRYSLRPLRLTKQEEAERIGSAMSRMSLPASMLEQSFYTLSDGQKRKVAMATTIAVRPDWLLLDEPTAGIDPMSIPQLLETIVRHKRSGNGGIVLVSHDLDTFLPIADRVLIMSRGTIIADLPPEELCAKPELLLQARIGLPASVEIANALLEHGIALPVPPALTPDDTAAAIIRRLDRGAAAPPPDAAHMSGAAPAHPAAPTPDTAQAPSAVCAATTRAARVQQLHPITKWVLYLLLSAGTLIQNQWPGVAAAAVVACACIALSGARVGTLLKPVKPFMLFILISAMISGLSVSFYPDTWTLREIDFSWASALRTVKQLCVYLLMMLLGILFALTTSPSMMQRGLERSLAFLERLRIPVAMLTFSASLLFRFIPTLFDEIDKISLITRARGKSQVKPGSIRLRDAHVFMIPLMLSMMKHAEDLAFALEARGYKLKRLSRSRGFNLHIRRSDRFAWAAGLILLVILIAIHFDN